MFCTKCGYKNEDSVHYCVQCGNALVQLQPMPNGQQPQAANSLNNAQGMEQQKAPFVNRSETPSWNTVPYTSPVDTASQAKVPYTDNQGIQPQTADPGNSAPIMNPPKKKSKRLLLWLIPLIVILMVAILSAVLIFRPKKAPIMENVLKAIQGTLESESFSFTLDAKEETDYGDYDTQSEGIVEWNLAKGRFNFDVTTDDTEFILWKDTSYFFEEGDFQYSTDIQDNLDMIYDYYDEYNTGLDKLSNIDWEELMDEAGLSSFVDEDKLDKCISELQKKLNDKVFYQEICKKFKVSSSGKTTTYLFDFDTVKATEAIYNIFEPALEDSAKELSGFSLMSATEERAKGLKELLLDSAEKLTTLTLELSITENRLSSVNFEFAYSYEDDTKEKAIFELKLSEYNKASIDEDRIKAFITELPDSDSSATLPYTESTATPTEVPEESVAIPTEAPEDGSFEPASLELWYMNYGESDPVIQDSIDRFLAEYPDSNVNVTVMNSEEYRTRLEVARASGDMPDIFSSWIEHSFYTQIMNGDILDITEYMEAFGYQDRFLDGSVAEASYRDRIYGVPVGGSYMYGVFYNRDIFSAYGFSEPETIEELEQICNELLVDGITPFELGNIYNYPGNVYFSGLATRKSGVEPYMAAIEGNPYALEDGLVYAGSKLQEWIRNGYFNEDMNSLDDYDAQYRFSMGESAMYLNGSWSISSLKSSMYDNLGFFEFPAYSADDANARLVIGSLGNTFYSISSSCENPEAAFELLQYLSDDIAINQRLAADEYFLPAVKGYIPVDLTLQEVMDAASRATGVSQLSASYFPYAAYSELDEQVGNIFRLSIDPQDMFYSIIGLW